MSPVLPALRTVAQRLMAAEAAAAGGEGGPVAFLVFRRFKPALANLLGNGGVHALFCRSLALSRAQTLPDPSATWIREVTVTEGSLEISESASALASTKSFAVGGMILVYQLLTLLVLFIGEKLTFRVVQGVWPEILLNDLTLHTVP